MTAPSVSPEETASAGLPFCPHGPAQCADARADIVRSFPMFSRMREELLGAGGNPEIPKVNLAIARTAPIWFIPADMTELVDFAAGSVPHDTTLHLEMLVERSGLAFFAAPILRDLGVAAEGWHFNALQWGMAQVDGEPAVMFSLFSRGRDRWACIGESWWHLGTDLGDQMKAQGAMPRWLSDDAGHTTHLQDRALVASLWLVSSQKGLTESSLVELPRPFARRALREFLPTSAVRVLRLRGSSPGDSQGGEVAWSHRWIVRGHWRQQPCGPQNSMRRPQWIHPHVKGPTDRPIDIREGVRVLNRAGAT